MVTLMNLINSILNFFFKRKYFVRFLVILLSTVFFIDLLFYKDFNFPAFGGMLCLGIYFILNKNKLNTKYDKN